MSEQEGSQSQGHYSNGSQQQPPLPPPPTSEQARQECLRVLQKSVDRKGHLDRLRLTSEAREVIWEGYLADLDALKDSVEKQMENDGKADERIVFLWRAKKHFLRYLNSIDSDAGIATRYIEFYNRLSSADQGA